MSSSAFDTIARNWGDSVAKRVHDYLAKQEVDLPIRVRVASDFARVSRATMASIFEELERASVLKSASLPLCTTCDEIVEVDGEAAPECDLCEKVVRGGKTEICFKLQGPLLYPVPAKPPVEILAEGSDSLGYSTGETFEDISWDSLNDIGCVDALVMTAVKVELRAARAQLLPPAGHERVLRVTWKESTYYIGRIGSYSCAVVMSEAGSGGRQGAALTLHDAIARLRPSFAIAVGIAFGRDPNEQAIGDLLISTIVVPYEAERVQPDGNIARAPHPEAGIVLTNRLRALDSEKDFEMPLRFGPLLSGEKLVDDPAFKAKLFKAHPAAIGGEMEAAGIYAAADRNRLEWIVVKGICDWGDGKKNKEHQRVAAENACAVLQALLSRGGLERSNFGASSIEPHHSGDEMPEIAVTKPPGSRAANLRRPGRRR